MSARSVFCALGLSAMVMPSAHAQDSFPVVLVDKATHQISMAYYRGDKIEIKKSFHVTTGKAVGDKEVEKDLKTPDGVYFFTAKLTPPSLKKKFGAMALMMNYPNPIDRLAGKTGYDIMLHSTDDLSRLQRNLDSEGCVVVNDEQITEIAKEVRLGLTPIIIYPELKPEFLSSPARPEVRQAFESWLNAWNSKDLETYIGAYSPRFSYNGMNLNKYREHKKGLNAKYDKISVKADNLRFFTHPKYDVVAFTQRYESTMKRGGTGFKSAGTKYLYFVREDGKLRIAEESYSTLKEN